VSLSTHPARATNLKATAFCPNMRAHPVASWPDSDVDDPPPSLHDHYNRFITVGSEVAHRVAPMLATVRRSNRACSFPAHGFHEDSCFRDAIEGIS
jgi:hypothetical protein